MRYGEKSDVLLGGTFSLISGIYKDATEKEFRTVLRR